MLHRIFFVLVAMASLAVAPAAQAQLFGGTEKTAIKEGFTFAEDEEVRIVVFRPDVSVSSLSTAGIDEPNADWTEAARRNLTESLKRAQTEKGNELIFLDELEGADAEYLADYQNLFSAVTGAVVVHKLFTDKLPTKKDAFDWTLGPGVSRLAEIGGGDYGLFVYTDDAYSSAGLKVMRFLMGGVPPRHIGYAGLVDLRTGDLIWINADIQMGGDVREPDGAEKRIKQLLEGFPLRELTVSAQ
ncbi:MAG: hypothetical protein AAFX04_04145 [Pseudomonadota bacterium]